MSRLPRKRLMRPLCGRVSWRGEDPIALDLHPQHELPLHGAADAEEDEDPSAN